ncbi:transcriptional regulator NrdR [Desulfococcaceae bacterium OttesenSCG-928-F15]|nr:transcriptional regulator NrdR [Desulfococcaceae bacterium OttesenSCG-928-F15]
MRCPFCGFGDSKVMDSRLTKEGDRIRRRRECLSCARRFTTYEQTEEIPIMIVKKDSRRENFSKEKLRNGILRACEKRNISVHTIDGFLDDLEHDIRETGEKEVSSSVLGEKVIAWLHDLDAIAYVRFASVYREFKDVNDFVDELKSLLIRDKNP